MLKVIRNALIILSIAFIISSLVTSFYIEFRSSSFTFEGRSRREIRTKSAKSLLHFVSNLQIPALGFFFAHKIFPLKDVKALHFSLFFLAIALYSMVAFDFARSLIIGGLFNAHIPSLLFQLGSWANSTLIATMCIYAGCTLKTSKNSHPNEMDT